VIEHIQRIAGFLAFGMSWLVLISAQGQQNNGSKVWEFDAKNRVSSSPTVGADGTIYVGAGNQLVALYPNGKEKWRFSAQGAILSSPAVDEKGCVYFGSLDHKVYAVNNGIQLWPAFTTGGPIYSSPAVDEEGTIYIGSDDFKLYAIAAGGKQKWAFLTGGYVRSSPSIGAGGLLYFGSFDSGVYAVDKGGNEIWKFETGHYVYSSPAIDVDGTIYVGSVDKSLYAINSNGSKKWSYATGSHIYSSPAIGPDGTIYIGSWDNKLHAVSPAGVPKWTFATGNLVQSAPVVDLFGTVYFGSDENKIYAVSPAGNKLWAFVTGSLVRSSPLLSRQGVLYCGSEDNHLYAIKALSGPAVSSWPLFRGGPNIMAMNTNNSVVSSWPMFRGGPSRRGRVLLVITNQPQKLLVTVGHAASLSVAVSGAGPLYYQWLLNGTNIPNAKDNTLSITNAQIVHAGNYIAIISNTLETVISEPAPLTVVTPPVITLQPVSQTNIVGSTISFRAQAESKGPVTYGWFFQTNSLGGETNQDLTLANLAPSHAGDYAVVIGNSAGAVTSAVAKLNVVGLPEITQQPQNQVGAVGSTVAFSMETAKSIVPISYQWRLNGTNIPGANGPKWEIKNVQPSHGGNYTVAANNMAGTTVSVGALLTVTMPPIITTHPKSQTGVVDRAISLGVAANSAGPLTYQWFFGTSALTNATGNTLAIAKAQTNDAGPYFVVVSNVAGVVTSATAALSILVPPAVLTPPQNQTGAFGKSVVFTVSASGTSPLDYSWRFNDTNFLANTNPLPQNLVLSALVPEQSGKYTVVITNSAGSITSAPALLTVPRPLSVWERAKSFFGGGGKK